MCGSDKVWLEKVVPKQVRPLHPLLIRREICVTGVL